MDGKKDRLTYRLCKVQKSILESVKEVELMTDREAEARKEIREDSLSMKNKFSRMIPAKKCEFCKKPNVIINFRLDLQAANTLRRLFSSKVSPTKSELDGFPAKSYGTCQSCLQQREYMLLLHTYIRNWAPEQILADLIKYLE